MGSQTHTLAQTHTHTVQCQCILGLINNPLWTNCSSPSTLLWTGTQRGSAVRRWERSTAGKAAHTHTCTNAVFVRNTQTEDLEDLFWGDKFVTCEQKPKQKTVVQSLWLSAPVTPMHEPGIRSRDWNYVTQVEILGMTEKEKLCCWVEFVFLDGLLCLTTVTAHLNKDVDQTGEPRLGYQFTCRWTLV